MTVVAPERTIDQRMSALAYANEIRVKRATLKRTITGQEHAAGIILDPPDYVTSMRVAVLLAAIPRWGSVKATRTLRVCRISESKTLGGLSERQRHELARELRR